MIARITASCDFFRNATRSFRTSCLPFLAAALLLTTAVTGGASAQVFNISGTISSEHGQTLEGAHLALFTQADTLLIRGTTSRANGVYRLSNIPQGDYHMIISFLGYQTTRVGVALKDQDISGLNIRIQPETLEMDGVEITAQAQPVIVREDTTIFNAAAFPVHADAVAEDLIRRMPGFVVQNGQVQAQGEQVQRVLVDGQEFFGDDPSIALRNLPADIIRQIQVLDQASDQAQFTGFDDGETIRTINIITRGGIRDGQFGQTNASMGSDERYLGGGNINYFNGHQRISVLGLTNNINQVNFTSDDLTGVAEASQTSTRAGRGGGGGGGSWFRSDNTSNFLLGEAQGINTVHSFGLNYIDRWGDSWRISSSYFFNNTGNTNDRIIEREFLEESALEDHYYEQSYSRTDQYNHRLNARIEYTIDRYRSLMIRPNVSFRYDQASQALTGATFASPGFTLSHTDLNYDSDSFRFDIANSILYRRSFETRGRTFSANFFIRADQRTGDQLHYGESLFYLPLQTSDSFLTGPSIHSGVYFPDDMDDFSGILPHDQITGQLANARYDHQKTDLLTSNRSFSVNFQYTEPIGERTQLSLSYRPTLDLSRSERNVFVPDTTGVTGLHTPGASWSYIPDTGLTSRFDNQVMYHRPGIGIRHRTENIRLNASLGWEYAKVEGEQIHPYTSVTNRSFSSLLPRVNMRFNLPNSGSVHLRYVTRTRIPTASQLQDVIDNTDPLLLSGGNPDLHEQYVHQLSARYRHVNTENHTSLMAFVSASYTLDYIGNRTFQATQDTLLNGNILLNRGSRLTTPDHTGNAWDLRLFVNYSTPVPFIKSNANINSGIRYRETPSLINDQRNIGYQTGLDAGLNINSVVSREVDFSLSYNAGYQFVRNSLRQELDNDYYTGRAVVRMNILPVEWLVLASDFNLIHFHGLGDAFNRDIYYWNASIGYRFLKDRSAQLRLTVTDILGQNSSVNRDVTDMYIQDVRSQVLTRYVMLTLSWNFRTFREG